MKILVTGAAGFIASHVVDLLLEQGHTVLALDNLSTGTRENLPKKIDFAKVDVSSWWDLNAEFCDFEPEVVVHLAAQPSISESLKCPIKDANANIIGTLNVIHAAQECKVKRLIFSSTSAVYWNVDSEYPIVEDFLKEPESPYGISKLAAETYVRRLMPDTGTVLRFGNVYGPRQVPLGENQVIPRLIKSLRYGDYFRIHGSGEQQRDFVYVKDVAHACHLAITGDPGVYNISDGKATSVKKIVEMVMDIYDDPECFVLHDEQEDPRRKVELDTHRAWENLGWQPEYGLEQGLRETVEWWKAQ